MMIIIAEFFVVILKVLWAFVTAGAKWVVRPKEKSVAGQVCVITGAGSGLGRLFAKEFARRRAILVLWDINSQSNEETAEMVRQIYHEVDTPLVKDGMFVCIRLSMRPFLSMRRHGVASSADVLQRLLKGNTNRRRFKRWLRTNRDSLKTLNFKKYRLLRRIDTSVLI